MNIKTSQLKTSCRNAERKTEVFMMYCCFLVAKSSLHFDLIIFVFQCCVVAFFCLLVVFSVTVKAIIETIKAGSSVFHRELDNNLCVLVCLCMSLCLPASANVFHSD